MNPSLAKTPNAKTLEQRLRSERPFLEAPADLTERVMSDLPAFGPAKRDLIPNSRALWVRLALAAGTLAVTFVVWKGSAPNNESANNVAPPTLAPESVEPIEIRFPNMNADQ